MMIPMSAYHGLTPVADPMALLRSKGMAVANFAEPQLRAFETGLLPVRDR
jgi:hypothetical protein